MNLHLMSHSPFHTSQSLTQTVQSHDTILLIADGCYHLQNLSLLQALISEHSPLSLKVLSEDAELRGLSEQLLLASDNIVSCNIDEFIQLTFTAQHILNW